MKGVMPFEQCKKSTKRTPLLNIYIYNGNGHFVYFCAGAKTAKMGSFVLFPKYNIFQKGDENTQIFKF